LTNFWSSTTTKDLIYPWIYYLLQSICRICDERMRTIDKNTKIWYDARFAYYNWISGQKSADSPNWVIPSLECFLCPNQEGAWVPVEFWMARCILSFSTTNTS